MLKELVEAYPGMLIFGGGTHTNPVRERFQRAAGVRGSRTESAGYAASIEALSQRFAQAFPLQFLDAKRTLDADVAWLKQSLAKSPK